MTKEKEMIKISNFLFWLLIILTLTLLFELPFAMVSASEEKIHNVLKTERTVDQPVDHPKEAMVKQTVKEAVSETNSETSLGTDSGTDSEASPESKPDDTFVNANTGGAATSEELDVLIHLINAEAYGLSYKAKIAVGQVVMNRWTGPYYGDNLYAIMTAPYQFTPIHDGSAYKKEIEPDSIKAAYAVLEGTGVKELTNDTYYFVNPDFTEDKTIENSMEFVCEIENIHFYKPSTK